MQNLWSRAARSKCTCRCLLCLNSARNGLSRRATTAAGNRKVEFKDAIFVAYMTIFATGIVADRKRKDRKREEWDKKIAEVKEEVELLRKKNDDRLSDARPLAAVVRRKIRIKTQVPGVKRLYSTAQAVAMRDDPPGQAIDDIIDFVDELAPSSPEKAPSLTPVLVESSGSSALDEVEKPAGLRSDSTAEFNPVLDKFANPRFVYNDASRHFVPNGIPANLKISSKLEDIDSIEQYNLVEKWIKSGLQPSLRARAIRSFSVKRLALKLVLRPAIQHSYGQPESFRVGGYIPRTYLREAFEGTSAQTVQELLHELAETKRHIWHAKTGEADDTKLQEMLGDTASRSEEADRNERLHLNNDLKALFNEFHEGGIDLKALLFKVATNLLHSPATPLTSTYEILVRGFTKARQMDVVHTVLESFRESRRGLSTGIISATLNFFTKSKDLLSFDKYVTWLTGKSTSEIFFVPWKTISIGTRDVAVPPKEEARILQTMIAGALRFDQPHRAEMWLAVLRRYGMAEDPYIVTVFLKYYALTCNWRQGKIYLGKAWKHLQSSTPKELATQNFIMTRMSFWMLHLCLNCRQVKTYRRVLNYTSDNNLDSKFVERYKHSWQADVIIQDWRDHQLTRAERSATLQEEGQSSELNLFEEEPPSDIELADAEEFVLKMPNSNTLDEKAMKATKALFQRSQHCSSQAMSKVPEGAILSPAAAGYAKDDLELKQLWVEPAFNRELDHEMLHHDTRESEHKTDITSSHKSSELSERLETTSNYSLADFLDWNRHEELLLRRLSIVDRLDEVIESMRHVSSQVKEFRTQHTDPPRPKSISTHSLETKPMSKSDWAFDLQRSYEHCTGHVGNTEIESRPAQVPTYKDGNVFDGSTITLPTSTSDVQSNQEFIPEQEKISTIRTDPQRLPIEDRLTPDLKIRFHAVGFTKVRTHLERSDKTLSQPLRPESNGFATKKGGIKPKKALLKPLSRAAGSKLDDGFRTYHLKLDQYSQVPQTSRQFQDAAPLDLRRKGIVLNPKKAKDELKPLMPPSDHPKAQASSDEAAVALPEFKIRAFPSVGPEAPFEIKKLVGWKSRAQAPGHFVEPEQRVSRLPVWGE